MAAIAKLYATLGLDNRGFLQGLTQSQGAMSRFGGAVAGGFGIGAGLGGFMLLERGIRAVVDGIGDAVTAASNITETQTKLDQVFMRSSDSMRDWAQGSAQTMIMSEQAALASAATFGNFLQALGQTEEASASMSQQLVMLSADLASYNNLAGGAEEATMRLFSGMSGEMEAVRRLGIDLSETAVTTYLLANGVKRVGMQFRQSDKTAARFALIMKDTAKAQGDVERTGENLANRQREFNAEIGNLQAQLGAGLVGPMADFTGWLADVAGMFVGNQSLNRKIDEFTGRIYGLGAAAGEAAEQAGSGLGSFEDMFADLPGLDIIFPALAANTRFWRANHVALRQAGFDYYSLGGFVGDLTSKFGKSQEDAEAAVLAFTGIELATRRLNAAVAKTNRENWGFITGFRDMRSEAEKAGVSLEAGLDTIAGAIGNAAKFIVEDGGQIPEAFESVFDDAVFEINKGFGNVKSALADDPGIVAPEKRLENMRNRLAKTQANLRLAQQVGDPIGIDRWTKGVARAQTVLDQFETKTGKSKRQIVTTLEAMGLETSGIFGDIKRDTARQTDAAADAAIRNARRASRQVARAFEGMAPSARSWGADVTRAFAAGLASKNALAAIESGATNVMGSVQDFMRTGSPTKKGPGSKDGGPEGWGTKWGQSFAAGIGRADIDLAAALTPRRARMPAMAMAGGGAGGGDIHIHIGNVYGGQAGLRQLAADVERAVRPTRRERRHNRLAEG